MVAAVALAVLEEIADPAFLAEVHRKGEILTGLLEGLGSRHPERITEIRGRGLMRGLRLAEPVAPVVQAAQERGLLLVGAGPDVIRLLPPLTVTDDEISQAIRILEVAMEAVPSPTVSEEVAS